MNYEKKLAEINKQIECKKRELSDLRQKQREQKLAEIKKNKEPMKLGRPRISEDLLIQAVKLMETKTISDVCLRLNVSRTSLHRYGITRRALGGYRIGSNVIYESKNKV